MLRITNGRGFQLVFANGWTVSIQFGPGNYCENRDMEFGQSSDEYNASQRKAGEQGCGTAEIAAWPWQGELVSFGGDTVKGWVNANEVAAFIALVANLPEGELPNTAFAQLYDAATKK